MCQQLPVPHAPRSAPRGVQHANPANMQDQYVLQYVEFTL
eukprot:COSAG02_NODE_9145_length_2313_cov_1.395212_1_plen_40_part_00